MKLMVDLTFGDPFGLVVPHPSGITFTNQAAGVLCQHPSAEGFFIPLDDGIGHPALWTFDQHFSGAWNALNEKDVTVIDGALRKAKLGYVRVNRAKLTESVEAWMHVLVDPKKADSFLEGSETFEAILTWPNSD